MTADSIWFRAGQAPPAGSPLVRLWDWLAEQVDAALYHPCAAPGIIARRLREDGVTYYVLKNPANNAYLKLSEPDYALWVLMDGSRSVKDLIVIYFEKYHTLALGRVASLVNELKQAGFLTDKPVNVFQQVASQLAQRDWTFRWKQLARAFLQHEFAIGGLDGWMSALYRAGGRWLFTPVAQVLFILTALAGLVAFILVLTSQRYTILATGGSYWLGLFLLWGANFVVIAIHEHAHALTTKHFQRELTRGGFLIYYGMPAFFVDTMDIWLEPKPRRLAVTWAGPYSGLIVGGLCSLAAWLLPDSLLGHLTFKVAFVCYVGVLVNLNPLLELDGYFMLIDWLGIPNLRERSLAFIRAELWPKLKTVFAAQAPPAFTREETIFTAYGILAAGYTFYTVLVAVYFWQTRFSTLLVQLWNRPSPVAKLAALIFGAGVIGPVVLVIGITAWSALRSMVTYLDKQHFFESERNVTLVLLGGLALVTWTPAVMGQVVWRIYAGLVPTLLLGLAVIMLVQTARQHAGARFQLTFWAMAASAMLLTIGAMLRGFHTLSTLHALPSTLHALPSTLHALPSTLHALFPILLEQLATLPLLVVVFQSLLEVDLRSSPLVERVMVILLLALSFIVIIPIARWTTEQAWPFIALAAGAPYLTMMFIAAMIPMLATCYGTRFFIPWVTLTLAVALNGALCLVRLAPAWWLGSDTDVWLGLLAAGVWAMGSTAYVMAGTRWCFETAHWSQDLLLSDNERLRLAFARLIEALFVAFRSAFGARRAKAIDDDLDVIGVACDWDVEIDSGRVNDELDLSQITILEQADRYREVLARTIDLMDDWAGSAFRARAIQAAYDSLPWPERELLGQYVLAGSPWGGAIASVIGSCNRCRCWPPATIAPWR